MTLDKKKRTNKEVIIQNEQRITNYKESSRYR